MSVHVATIGGRFVYVVSMSQAAYDTLRYVGDLYPSADVLVKGSTYVRNVLMVPESTAHEYMSELPNDNGVSDSVLPPIVGGDLASSLLELWQAVV